jgi:hypothetical protein
MSFYDHNQLEQEHEQSQSPHHQLINEKNIIQLPKIIVQPGPSPYSSRKRHLNSSNTNSNNETNKVNKHYAQEQHLHPLYTYLNKSSSEHQQHGSNVHQSSQSNEIQIFQ